MHGRTSTLRVLVVHARYRVRAGEDAVVDREVALLRRHGHDVRLLTGDNARLAEQGPGRVLTAMRAVWWPAAGRTVARHAGEHRADIVHVHNTFPAASPAVHAGARASRTAIVHTVHNFRFECPSATLFRDGHPCRDCVGRAVPWPGVVHRCYRDSVAASAMSAAAIVSRRTSGVWSGVHRFIAPSEAVAAELAQEVTDPGRIVVKPNFALDRGVGADGDREGVVYAGRLTVEKGLPVLLDAWAALGGGSRLTILGTGPLEADVRAAAAADPTIRVLGEVTPEQVHAEVARARVLVFPSVWAEPFGLAIVEAYAAGTPVVASRSGAATELVEDGVTGLGYDPGDSMALAASLRRVMFDPSLASSLGAAARARYVERYSPGPNLRALEAIYDAALRAAAVPPADS